MARKKSAPAASAPAASAPAAAAAAAAPASAPVPAPAGKGAAAGDNTPPPPPPRYYSFVYVAQCDFPNQMAVHNWLIADPHFRIVWIKHDKDTYTKHDAETKPKQWKDGVHTRKNGDGTESQYRVGDVKPAHIHGYVRVQNKLTETGMSKRFGSYLHFDGVNDSYAALIYFTHSDFVSQVIEHKHQYAESELCGDMLLYKDNCRKILVTDNFGTMMHVYMEYVQKYGYKEAAIAHLLADGRLDVLADIRKNSGFYDRFVSHMGAQVQCDKQDIPALAPAPVPVPAPDIDKTDFMGMEYEIENTNTITGEIPLASGKRLKCIRCGRWADIRCFPRIIDRIHCKGVCGSCSALDSAYKGD